ncbi:DUF2690 domain-containing protein [Streptomyces sp. BK340]|uniref:DUF2690 domain-containing protein n=1 Tax=Streptomyces sp. BK340 TaxID=2572903 RepID=UPI0011AC85A4|nr:DUF2690 domain-containing protein [Streptomyces sp. BK340]TVZ90530.1 uncharacterized protein DUF2690 [Streptomyces sp. BK340]
MRTLKSIGVAALALAAGTTLVFTGPADAAGRKWDGKDPIYSGCADTGRLVHKKTDKYYSSRYHLHVSVTASLWYSRGCRTVWAMVDANVPTDKWNGEGCNIWRNSDMKHYGCKHRTGTLEMLSPMLNDKNTTGFATAWSYVGNDPHEMFARTASY